MVCKRRFWQNGSVTINWWYWILVCIWLCLCNSLRKSMDTVKNSINMFDVLNLIFTSVLGIYSIKSVLVLLPLEAVLSSEFNLYPFNLQPISPWPVWPIISSFQWLNMFFNSGFTTRPTHLGYHFLGNHQCCNFAEGFVFVHVPQ